MRARSTGFLILAIGALSGVCAPVHAAITVFDSQAAFAGATTAPGVDTYAGFSIVASTPSPITRAAGPYTYTGAVTASAFFGAGTTANPWLSTNTATDTITFNNFSGGASAIGGNFFGSSISGSFVAGDITLVATDNLGASVTRTIVAATTSSFLGFVSTGTMSSLTVASVQPSGGGFLWPTVDNLTLGVGPRPDPVFQDSFE